MVTQVRGHFVHAHCLLLSLNIALMWCRSTVRGPMNIFGMFPKWSPAAYCGVVVNHPSRTKTLTPIGGAKHLTLFRSSNGESFAIYFLPSRVPGFTVPLTRGMQTSIGYCTQPFWLR